MACIIAVLFLILVLMETGSKCITISEIKSLTHHFKMQRTWLACPSSLKDNPKEAVKKGFGVFNDNFSYLVSQSRLGLFTKNDLILCISDYANLETTGQMFDTLIQGSANNAVSTHWIIVSNGDLHRSLVLNSTRVKVNQKVFFWDEDTRILTESYFIGGHNVQHTLGRFVDGNFSDLSPCSFFCRRSKLQGLSLVAMTSEQPPYANFDEGLRDVDEGWKKTESGSQLKDITGELRVGLGYDLVYHVEKAMNFTTKLLINRSGKWGHLSKNGTWSGMIGNLLRGDADFIAASLTYTRERFEVVDYLLPIGTETPIMVITQHGLEEYSWQTFWMPFQTNLWYCMFLSSLAMLVGLIFIKQHNNSGRNVWDKTVPQAIDSLVRNYWMIIASNLGWTLSNKLPKGHNPKRVLYFVISLSGMAIMFGYKSSLTAELAIRREDLPFDSLESLLKSDYRVITTREGRFHLMYSGLFENARENSMIKDLYAKHIEQSSSAYRFENVGEAVQHLKVTSQNTLFSLLENMHPYHCDVTVAWRTRYPRYLSFGFPKDSPYFEFVNYHFLKFRESGIMASLSDRHLKINPNCKGPSEGDRTPEDVPIGLRKIIGLFAVFAISLAIVIYLLCWEMSFGKVHQKDGEEKDDFLPEAMPGLNLWRFVGRKRDVGTKPTFLAELESLCETWERQRGPKIVLTVPDNEESSL